MRRRGTAVRWGSSLITSALFATLLVLTGPAVPIEVPLAPSAGSTYLCSGYSGCKAAGYGNRGYAKVSHKMFWRMYSGHNCTNYAAYRIIKAGGPAERPWSGGGNASEWGKYMSRITDQVPNVGAIAWWGRYSNGSGSAGHVAYVERVVSPTEIIVSEDSWGGTFHWRRITKSSGRWPTGFIHFVDKAITPTAKPTVTGSPVVGSTLSATNGRWSVAPTSFSYRWVVDGVETDVLTPTYTLTAADRGKSISVKVRAKRSGYTDGVQYSAGTAPVAEGTFTLTAPPVVTGSPYVDEVLTATAGTWSPTPDVAPRWRWYADGRRIQDHHVDTLRLTPDLVGKTISVQAVARGTGFDNTRSPEVIVGEVVVGDIEVSRPFPVTGEPEVRKTLSITPGSYAPADATVGYRWLRDGVPIPGAEEPSYRLRGADVGTRVSAQVTLTRRNYRPWTQTLPSPGTVSTPPKIKVKTDGRKHRAWVVVKVRAPGYGRADGQVRIRIGGWRDTVRLVDGKAVVVRWSRLGERKVVVRYLGTGVVRKGKVVDSLTVVR